uniref:UPF0496 protein 4 n=1 Tax=Anthurium amnicola TaxID=1678845 RepID=A0A1D1XIW9_9ARAE
MFLHLPPLPLVHFPSRKPSSPEPLSLLFHTFEGSVLGHLRSLVLAPAGDGRPAVSFSYLSRAVDVLSSIHVLSDALVSDPSLAGSDDPALASYVASTISLLDVCNAVSAEVERLRRGRLLLLFAAHLLSPGASPDKIRRARDSIREWRGSAPRPRISSAADLVRDLARRGAPARGKMSALGRAIYAVEDASALIAGALVASLGGEVDLAERAKVPGERFAWGEAFDELRVALSGEIRGRCAGEAADVEASVRRLVEIMDDPAGDGGEKAEERLREAVKEVEDAAEELSVGLDGLGGAVNALFRTVLGSRNTALRSFRLPPNKCK